MALTITRGSPSGNVVVSLTFTNMRAYTKAVNQVRKNMANVGDLFDVWKKEYFSTIKTRFMTGGAGKQWRRLSGLSTSILRCEFGITRIGSSWDDNAGRRWGGCPNRILMSSLSDNYLNSWINRSHKDHSESINRSTVGSPAEMVIKNVHPPTANEFRSRTARGIRGFRGKQIPRRPVAWIDGDTKLIAFFERMLVKHALKDVESS